jgi:peroxiredoxin
MMGRHALAARVVMTLLVVTTLSLAPALVVSALAADPLAELDLIRPPRAAAAPDFTVPRLGSGFVALKELRGSAVFLNFWATWCPPCKTEMPSMERLYRRHKDRGLTIVAISIDAAGAEPVASFVRQLDLTFPIGLDPTLEVANRYTVRALPSSFLIDRSGNTVAIAVGPRDWDGTAAHTVVEMLVK